MLFLGCEVACFGGSLTAAQLLLGSEEVVSVRLQLNGSAQVKVPSHYISSQMLAPPGPVPSLTSTPSSLPRTTLPESKATTSSSDGGASSPTSPSKYTQTGSERRLVGKYFSEVKAAFLYFDKD